MEDDLVYSAVIDGTRMLCVSAISRDSFEECESNAFLNDRGYFVYERDVKGYGGISILAKLASLDAAFQFVDLFQSATAHAANTLSSYGLPGPLMQPR
jgi:hypothetical protein